MKRAGAERPESFPRSVTERILGYGSWVPRSNVWGVVALNTDNRVHISNKDGFVAYRRRRKFITEAGTIGFVFALCAIGILGFVFLKG